MNAQYTEEDDIPNREFLRNRDGFYLSEGRANRIQCSECNFAINAARQAKRVTASAQVVESHTLHAYRVRMLWLEEPLARHTHSSS